MDPVRKAISQATNSPFQIAILTRTTAISLGLELDRFAAIAQAAKDLGPVPWFDTVTPYTKLLAALAVPSFLGDDL